MLWEALVISCTGAKGLATPTEQSPPSETNSSLASEDIPCIK
jgi:hypothetical protein